MQYENNKKGLKKQLFAAIIMLLVAALALGTATYAWFVNNKFVEAKGMTVNATADSSLLIKGTAADGSTDTQYGSVGTNAVSVTTLKPATSADGKTFGKLANDVKVENSNAADATWTGASGAFSSSDLTSAAEDTNYITSEYDMKATVEAAKVYVSAITIGGTSADIDTSLRVAVKIGTTTKIYNPKGGTLTDSGKAGLYSGSAWSLAAPSYTTVNSDEDADCFSLAADTATLVYVYVWYEGQDTLCYTNKISTADKTVSLKFSKKTTN